MITKRSAKRLTGLAVAASVALAGFGIAGTAQASTSDATITITAKTAGNAGATYSAYLLGAYADTKFDSATGHLTTLTIAANSDNDANGAIASNAQAVNGNGSTVDAAKPMNWVAANWLGYATQPNMTDDTTSAVSPYAGKLQQFAALLAKDTNFINKVTPTTDATYSGTAIASDQTISFTGLTTGLYLIVDSSGESLPMIVGTKAWNTTLEEFVDFEDGGEGVKPALGVGVLKNEELPLIRKDIINDANGFSIGEEVQYEVSFVIPTVKSDHGEAYTTTIVDTAGAGLTLSDVRDLKIFAGTNTTELQTVAGVSVSSSAQVLTIAGLENLYVTGTTGAYSNANSILVNGNPVDVSAGTVLFLRYTATVDADAVTIDASEDPANTTPQTTRLANNINTAVLTIPDADSADKEDTAVAYTFEIDLQKVDKDQPATKLEGAEFTVARADAPEVALTFSGTAGVYKLDAVGTDVITSQATTGKFSVAGLEAGDYIFTETKAPNDHFAVNAFTVTIAPNWADNEHLVETVEYQVDNTNADVWLSDVNTSTGISMLVLVGDPPATLANLPYTGGIGIAIFLIVGTAVTIIGIRAHRQSAKAENAAAAI